MRKHRLLSATAPVWAMAAFAMAACGDSDAPSGPGLDYGDKVVSGYRMEYSVELADPNVREVADVLVEYVGADGTTMRDTMEGATWQKTVAFGPSGDHTYGLAARFASTGGPAAQASYDFGADITSRLYVTYTNASPMFYMSTVNDSSYGILKPLLDGSFNTVRSAAYVTSPLGRADIDTTAVAYCFAIKRLESGKDSLVKSRFPFLPR